MTALLTNKSFQVYTLLLASIATLGTLLGIGAIDNSTGQSYLFGIIGLGIGLPLSAGTTTTTTTQVAPNTTQTKVTA